MSNDTNATLMETIGIRSIPVNDKTQTPTKHYHIGCYVDD